jgi:hypothetical protein
MPDLDELERGLDRLATAAAARAELPAAAAVRRRGRVVATRRRAVATVAVVALAAVLAVVLLPGRFGWVRVDTPPARTVGGTVNVPTPDPSLARVDMPLPAAATRDGWTELRGRTPTGTWWVSYSRDTSGRLCLRAAITPGDPAGPRCGAAAEVTARMQLTFRQTPGTTDEAANEDGTGHYQTVLSGVARPGASSVRVELLDGRVLVVPAVRSEKLGLTIWAAWLPQRILHGYVVVLDADGKLVSARSPAARTTRFRGENPVLRHPNAPGLRGTVTFQHKATLDDRVAVLGTIEQQGAGIWSRDGDRYDFHIAYPQHASVIGDGLEATMRTAHVAEFGMSRTDSLP